MLKNFVCVKMIRRFSPPQQNRCSSARAVQRAVQKAAMNLSGVNKRKQHSQLGAVDFSVGNGGVAQNAGIDNINSSVKVAHVDG
jgi:hypothetical protein